MEPAVTDALCVAQSLISSAVDLVKGKIPPLKAKFLHITSVPLSRSHHTISVIKGRAYIFGGESERGKLADNAMHIVILPSSGVLEADYTSIPARPAQPNGETPPPRKGHTAVVVGSSIYMFGGEGVESERGRIWAYSTTSNDWTHLDPSPDVPFPSHRTGHASAASVLPGPKEVIYKEEAPQQPADPAKVVPEPADRDTWGTVFVLGGRDTSTNELLNDGLAFDIKTRTWSSIPTPPGSPIEGTSLVLSGSHLYRLSGTDSNNLLQCLSVAQIFDYAKEGTTPLISGWSWDSLSQPRFKSTSRKDTYISPQPRMNAGLTTLTTGQGRHYILLLGGSSTHEPSTIYSDVWVSRLPPEHGTIALVKDTVKASTNKDTRVMEWAEVRYVFIDDTGEEKPWDREMGAGQRTRFAVTRGSEVDAASVVVWGGCDGKGDVLGDGWLVYVEH